MICCFFLFGYACFFCLWDTKVVCRPQVLGRPMPIKIVILRLCKLNSFFYRFGSLSFISLKFIWSLTSNFACNSWRQIILIRRSWLLFPLLSLLWTLDIITISNSPNSCLIFKNSFNSTSLTDIFSIKL